MNSARHFTSLFLQKQGAQIGQTKRRENRRNIMCINTCSQDVSHNNSFTVICN